MLSLKCQAGVWRYGRSWSSERAKVEEGESGDRRNTVRLPRTTSPGMLSKRDRPAPPRPAGTSGAAHSLEPSRAQRLQVPRLVIWRLFLRSRAGTRARCLSSTWWSRQEVSVGEWYGQEALGRGRDPGAWRNRGAHPHSLPTVASLPRGIRRRIPTPGASCVLRVHPEPRYLSRRGTTAEACGAPFPQGALEGS